MKTAVPHQFDVSPVPKPKYKEASGLELHASFDPSDPIFEAFYLQYDRAFVLPNEKEERQGFEECLKLNHGVAYQDLASRFGPFREPVAIAILRDTAGHPITIGGVNFITYPLQGDSGEPCLGMNLNYAFVVPEWRGKGLLRKIIAACEGLVKGMFLRNDGVDGLSNMPLLMFMELNDPFRLTQTQYDLDTQHAGIDQFQRLGVWARVGARIIDFPYVQPPLSREQDPDDTLSLALIGGPADCLPACILLQQLERFFAISVLKGSPLEDSNEAMSQLALLRTQCAEHQEIALLAMTRMIRNTNAQIANSERHGTAKTLREFLRRGDLA